jgi:hypothetical protein
MTCFLYTTGLMPDQYTEIHLSLCFNSSTVVCRWTKGCLFNHCLLKTFGRPPLPFSKHVYLYISTHYLHIFFYKEQIVRKEIVGSKDKHGLKYGSSGRAPA